MVRQKTLPTKNVSCTSRVRTYTLVGNIIAYLYRSVPQTHLLSAYLYGVCQPIVSVRMYISWEGRLQIKIAPSVLTAFTLWRVGLSESLRLESQQSANPSVDPTQ